MIKAGRKLTQGGDAWVMNKTIQEVLDSRHSEDAAGEANRHSEGTAREANRQSGMQRPPTNERSCFPDLPLSAGRANAASS